MEQWTVTQHACRVCLGRILERRDERGNLHARCADCGLEKEGDHRKLCACGTKLRDGRNAGLKCVVNATRTPEIPAEIVVTVDGRYAS